jgi:FkbM family methyltransferase
MLFGSSSTLTDATDDLPFQHYSHGHRVTAWISRCLFDRITYTVRHGLIRGMQRKGGLGWMPACLSHSAQTREEMFWRHLPLDGLVVYDVGAFHGILTLFFASSGAQVIAYEPNDRNNARLIENMRLNKATNVQVRKLGVGSQPGSGILSYTSAMSGGGTLNPNTSAPISQRVEITTLDCDITTNALPPPDLIKIDIEGWELEALEGARAIIHQHHPALFLEMHGNTMGEKKRKASAIVKFLHDAGYTDIVHVESDTAITPLNTAIAAEGHLFCRYTPK